MLSKSLHTLRIIALIIVLAVLLSSCGLIIINHPSDTGDTEDTTSITEPAETDDPAENGITSLEKAIEYLSELESRDMGGKTITIVEHSTWQDKYSEIYDVYDTVTAERDKLVEEKYNVKIERVRKSTDTIIKDLLKAKRSKEAYADLLLIPQSYVGFLQKNDILYNVAALPGTDYTKPYFDRNAMLQATMGNETYAAIGDASKLVESYYCMFVNKDILKELGLDIPYLDVYQGKWTYEKFSEYVNTISSVYSQTDSETGGKANTNHKPEKYALGFEFGSTKELINIMFFSTSQNYFTCKEKELPKRTFDTELTESYIEFISSLISDESAAFDTSVTGSIAISAFTDGKIPFYIGKVSDLFQLTNKGLDWGIIPFPKASESQSGYGSVTSDTSSVYVVPSRSEQDEDIGLIIQALNAAYYGAYNESLYKQLTLYFISDGDTLNMLDLIYNGGLYDLSEMFSDIPAIRNATFDVITSTAEGSGSIEDNFKKSEYAMNLYMKKYFKIDEEAE